MPVYRYKAIKDNGERTEGTYAANSRQDVISMLRDKGYYPIDVQEEIQGKDIKAFNLFSKVKIKDIAVFCRQFYAMLNSGITIVSCLDVLKQQTENKKLRIVIGEVYDDVQKGLTFSEALRKHDDVFPELLINMVEAGEVSGNLDDIMARMAVHFEKENKINNKIKGAMVYPIVLSILAVVVVVFLLTFVMPTFVGMFQGTGLELPMPTRILLRISDIIRNYWYIIISILLIAAVGIKRYIKTDNGRYIVDSIKFRLPIVKSTTKKVITSRFTRTLSTLLSSGVSLIQALEIVSKVVGNKVVSDGILEAKEEIRKGISLAEPLDRIGVFPPMVVSMIRIGEDSGSLDEILDKTANFFDEEVEASIQKMTTLLEPLMIIAMAVIVGFIVIAMVMPMFDMINTIQL
jgi:type IV pilus assembly protein PilC